MCGCIVVNKFVDMLLFLIGIMGFGKFIVGVLLVKVFGYNYLDTDEFIKSVIKKTSSEFFVEAGESEFCVIESMIFVEVVVYK